MPYQPIFASLSQKQVTSRGAANNFAAFLRQCASIVRSRAAHTMKPTLKIILKSFSAELPVYAALVTIYFFLVLRFLGDWLAQLFHSERKLYAILAIVLIVGQGYALEILTRVLFRLIRGKQE
jgi:hypothetical protein